MDPTPRRTRPFRRFADAAGTAVVAALGLLMLHTGWAMVTASPPVTDHALQWWEDRQGGGAETSAEAASQDSAVVHRPDGVEPAAASGRAEPAPSETLPDSADTGEGAVSGLSGGPAEPVHDHAAEVTAAVDILTRHDDGTVYPNAARWRQPTVTVAVTGDQATDQVRRAIDEVLAWMTETTGVDFVRTEPANPDLQVTVDRSKSPRGYQHIEGDRIVYAEATWNTSYSPWAQRWMWEELVHMSGPLGDHGPAETLFNSDMVTDRATDFDRWLVEGLYRAQGTSASELRAWFDANPRQ